MNETPRRSRRGVRSIGVRQGVGGAKGIRTPDLLNAIQTLSQLSYSPTPERRSIRRARSRPLGGAGGRRHRDTASRRPHTRSASHRVTGALRNGLTRPAAVCSWTSALGGPEPTFATFARQRTQSSTSPSRGRSSRCRCSSGWNGRSRPRAGRSSERARDRPGRRPCPRAGRRRPSTRRRRTPARGAAPRRCRPHPPGRGRQRLRHAARRASRTRSAPRSRAIVDRVDHGARLRGHPRRAGAPRRRDGRRRHAASGRSSRSSTTSRSPRSWSTARPTSTSSGTARSSASTRVFLNDEHVLRIIDRIITPAGPADRRDQPARRRPPARRLARQRDHRAAVARRAGHHRPEVLDPAVHGRRPDPASAPPRPRCSSSSTPASRPGSTCSSRAARAPARRRPSTSCRRSSPTTSGSSRSRTPPSSSSARST